MYAARGYHVLFVASRGTAGSGGDFDPMRTRAPPATTWSLDTAHRFRAGSRIRLIVAGGSFPQYARNLGTGENPVTGATLRRPGTRSRWARPAWPCRALRSESPPPIGHSWSPGPSAGYEVLGEVGRGSAATVLRVRRIADGASYALKILTADAGSGPAALCREAALLAGVDHPGVVQVHEVGAAAGRPYLVMDLVDGQPLARLLDRRRAPARTGSSRSRSTWRRPCPPSTAPRWCTGTSNRTTS